MSTPKKVKARTKSTQETPSDDGADRDATAQAIYDLATVLKNATGASPRPDAPPAFLEGIALALGGTNLRGSVAESLSQIAEAIHAHADAVDRLAAAIETIAEKRK
jgi:hypothetical protein